MMEIKHTLEILTKDIQDIEKLVGNLQNSPEGSALEMDLALSKLRNVYEILTMIREDRLHLRKASDNTLQDEPIPQGPAPKQEEDTAQAGNRKEAAILAEKFSTESSINENLATRRGDDMDSKLKGQPIDSISRNIGINDRFFIIRELFDGNAAGFRSLLDQLDGATSFEDARRFIGERFPDQLDHEGVQILIQLAKRRFRK